MKNQAGLFEPKIGELFLYDGGVVQCLRSFSQGECAECALRPLFSCHKMACFHDERTDKVDCFFEWFDLRELCIE